jgi:hypothetical protein
VFQASFRVRDGQSITNDTIYITFPNILVSQYKALFFKYCCAMSSASLLFHLGTETPEPKRILFVISPQSSVHPSSVIISRLGPNPRWIPPGSSLCLVCLLLMASLALLV